MIVGPWSALATFDTSTAPTTLPPWSALVAFDTSTAPTTVGPWSPLVTFDTTPRQAWKGKIGGAWVDLQISGIMP